MSTVNNLPMEQKYYILLC